MPVLETTPNNDFAYPTAANNGVDFSTGLQDFADAVDGMWSSGTLVARPVAGTRNRVYYATDTKQWFLDTGVAWVALAPSLTAIGTTSNLTAAAGQDVEVNASCTVTLPAPNMGSQIVVLAGTGISGSFPAMIAAAGSAKIFGVGADFVSSIQLGTSGAAVTLLGNGSNWLLISGQQDTGWQTLSLISGASWTSGGYAAAARLRGDTVTLRGTLVNTTGSSQSGTIATLPTGLRPSASIVSASTPFGTASGSTVAAAINASGQISPNGASWPTTATAPLDGITFTLA